MGEIGQICGCSRGPLREKRLGKSSVNRLTGSSSGRERAGLFVGAVFLAGGGATGMALHARTLMAGRWHDDLNAGLQPDDIGPIARAFRRTPSGLMNKGLPVPRRLRGSDAHGPKRQCQKSGCPRHIEFGEDRPGCARTETSWKLCGRSRYRSRFVLPRSRSKRGSERSDWKYRLRIHKGRFGSRS